MLLAIDPGTRSAGVALFHLDSRQLALAFAVRTESPDCAAAEILERIWHYVPLRAVVEVPREYQARPGVRADNLITLALLCGELRGAFMARWSCPTRYVTAPEWKGGLPKPDRAGEPYIVERRCRAILSEAEAASVSAPASKTAWDVWDAVGLGLVDIGRAAVGLRGRG